MRWFRNKRARGHSKWHWLNIPEPPALIAAVLETVAKERHE